MTAPGARTAEIHPNLTEERDHGVAVLTIDRPERRGALSDSMVAALQAYCTTLASTHDIHALVITGTDGSFISGADIEFYAHIDQDEFDRYQRRSRLAFEAVEQLPQVTIAAVGGPALGGGFELALCCDLMVATRDARVGLPEVRLGLIPGGGGTQRLPRAIGSRLAKKLLITGAVVRAETLEHTNLFAELVDDDVRGAAVTLARTVADGPVRSALAIKRVVTEGLNLSLREGLDLEQVALSEVFATPDAKEGIRAFLEKRPADWEGAKRDRPA